MSAPAGQTATRVRYGVLGFVCVLSMITYLDRAAFPNVQEKVREALNLPTIDGLTWAFTAFNLAYALFEVPTGWLGDVFGPRKTLIRIVLWWSFFIGLTGLVGEVSGIHLFGVSFPTFFLYGFWLLVVVRFLFGIGEAGAYPNIARALYNWFPLRERGRASGIVWMTARLMGGLTPLIMTVLLTRVHMHWRAVFWLFAVLGIIWCIAFWFWFRNRPEEKASVNAAELALITQDAAPSSDHSGVPWRRIVTNPSVWALCLMYICTNYGWYFSMNYLPAFMQDHYGVEKESLLGSLYKGGPLLLGMVGCFLGGLATDYYVRRTGNRKWGRRVCGISGHFLAGICMLSLILIPTQPSLDWLFALTIALAGFFNDMTMASAWASCQDVGRRYSAIVSGCMNMIGNLGGAATTFFSGFIVRWKIQEYAAQAGVTEDVFKKSGEFLATRLQAEREGWHINFALYGGFYLAAIVFWLMLNANRTVDEPTSR